jgi:hypothetical protein
MKKTIHKRKLQLSKTTLRQLSGTDLRRAAGALGGLTPLTCWWPNRCHSLFDSCGDSDCCLASVKIC